MSNLIQTILFLANTPQTLFLPYKYFLNFIQTIFFLTNIPQIALLFWLIQTIFFLTYTPQSLFLPYKYFLKLHSNNLPYRYSSDCTPFIVLYPRMTVCLASIVLPFRLPTMAGRGNLQSRVLGLFSPLTSSPKEQSEKRKERKKEMLTSHTFLCQVKSQAITFAQMCVYEG